MPLPMVEVVVMTYRAAKPEALVAIDVAHDYLRSTGEFRTRKWYAGNCLVHQARNEVLGRLHPEYDYLLMIDDDMVPAPDAMARLLSHRAKVASALCTTRYEPVEYCVKIWDEVARQFVAVEWAPHDRVITRKFGVGAAFLALRRDAVEELQEYYLSARDWMEQNRRTFDRMRVRSELRETERSRIEQIRRANYAKDKYLRIFSHPVQDNERELGEDIALSKMLVDLNIPITIDSTFLVGHLGDRMYSMLDYVPAADRENAA